MYPYVETSGPGSVVEYVPESVPEYKYLNLVSLLDVHDERKTDFSYNE